MGVLSPDLYRGCHQGWAVGLAKSQSTQQRAIEYGDEWVRQRGKTRSNGPVDRREVSKA